MIQLKEQQQQQCQINRPWNNSVLGMIERENSESHANKLMNDFLNLLQAFILGIFNIIIKHNKPYEEEDE